MHADWKIGIYIRVLQMMVNISELFATFEVYEIATDAFNEPDVAFKELQSSFKT